MVDSSLGGEDPDCLLEPEMVMELSESASVLEHCQESAIVYYVDLQMMGAQGPPHCIAGSVC